MEPPTMAGWNLATRFALELAALIALGLAGWKLGEGGWRWIAALGVPLGAAIIWATFNVPGDPSRSGRAPVEVNGWIRLGVELLVLGSGAVAIWYAGQPVVAGAFIAAAFVQYATSLDRIGWLVAQ